MNKERKQKPKTQHNKIQQTMMRPNLFLLPIFVLLIAGGSHHMHPGGAWAFAPAAAPPPSRTRRSSYYYRATGQRGLLRSSDDNHKNPAAAAAPFALLDPSLRKNHNQSQLQHYQHYDFTLPVSFSDNNENENPLVVTTAETTTKEDKWVDESKFVELVGLALWMASISAFILANNFVGPWPPGFMEDVPERIWFLGHMLGGMLFGGGVLLTTAIEYLVATNSNASVLQFWFDKVPLLDMAIVLPGLTLAMVSGTGLSVARYGSLGSAPVHVELVFWALVVFATWWGVTDLTTQGGALNAVQQHAASVSSPTEEGVKAPDIVLNRTVSNVVSCLLVLVVYSIMVLKPGTIKYW